MSNVKEYGIFLREEREKQGLSLEKVSKDTKITIKILEGLESMKKDILPSETYRKGMLKVYARYLKIDEKEIMGMLKVNDIQEKPVEFDLINLQKEKRKKRIRFIFLIAGMVVASFLAIGIFRIASGFFAERSQRIAERKSGLANLQVIDGFYEANFSEGSRVVLKRGDVEKVAEIKSISPSIIQVGEQEYTLETSRPVLVTLDEEKSVSYVVFLRSFSLSKKELLLRFDTRVEEINLVTLDNANGEIISDGEKIEVLTSASSVPIRLEMSFRAYARYKITANGEIISEGEKRRGTVENISLNSSVRILISNTSFVDMIINETEVNIPRSGLPAAYYLSWEQNGDQQTLWLTPIP